jgi:hypothetical protein
MRGLYPKYEMHLEDKIHDIIFDLEYNAVALPHWIAQDITGGWLPMGLGSYRYGFIPRGDLTGTMKKDNKIYNIKGEGYWEHVWGDFFYDNPISTFKEFKKTVSIYSRLIGWHLLNKRPGIPKSLIFTTENSPFGYDWVWALFDNGWTLFFGNILFWLEKGPFAGTFILSKDGKKYEEFSDVFYKYNKKVYSKEFDLFYPTAMELWGSQGDEYFYLKIIPTIKGREFSTRFTSKSYWIGFGIYESLGNIEGYYFDGEKKIELKGIAKVEPQRQASRSGHNLLEINVIRPPKGLGISLNLESHKLKKCLYTNIQLAPKIKLKFKTDKLKIPERKKETSNEKS